MGVPFRILTTACNRIFYSERGVLRDGIRISVFGTVSGIQFSRSLHFSCCWYYFLLSSSRFRRFPEFLYFSVFVVFRLPIITKAV